MHVHIHNVHVHELCTVCCSKYSQYLIISLVHDQINHLLCTCTWAFLDMTLYIRITWLIAHVHTYTYMYNVRVYTYTLSTSIQAAYLVGVAHPSSIPATPQIIDKSNVSISSHVILLSCQQLESGSTSSSPWTLAHSISRHSSMLSDASKRAALLSSSPVTRCDFLRAARSIADTTAALLRGIEVRVSTSHTMYMYMYVRGILLQPCCFL